MKKEITEEDPLSDRNIAMEQDPLHIVETLGKKKSKCKGTTYPCDQCEYTATSSSTLKKHKESQHEGIRYSCNLCDFMARQPHTLKLHISSKHEGIRYPCDLCEYTAINSK